VTLKKGANTILVKVSNRSVNPWNNGERGWGFSCRIGDAYGRPMAEGIRVSVPEGVPEPLRAAAKKAPPYTVIDTRILNNHRPGYGGAAVTDGVISVHRWTLPETGWEKAFYLLPKDRALYSEGNETLWTYPISMTNNGVVFTAYAASESGWRRDASNLNWTTDAFGNPICKSFFLSGAMSAEGLYSKTPVATVRFHSLPPNPSPLAPKKWRLCVTGTAHISAGGLRPFPDMPMKMAVVPAGIHPSAATLKAEATVILPYGGNYLDYGTLETVIDGDCDIYLVGIHENQTQVVSLFGVFLEPLH